MGGPPAGAPPPEGPQAGAPFTLPDAAARRLRQLAGKPWHFVSRTNMTWRYSVDEKEFGYTYEELGGERRTGQRAFTVSARGNICRSGYELIKLELEEDVASSTTSAVSAVWADHSVWVRIDPRAAAAEAAADAEHAARGAAPQRRRSRSRSAASAVPAANRAASALTLSAASRAASALTLSAASRAPSSLARSAGRRPLGARPGAPPGERPVA
eukprot:gene10708-18124_t